MRISTIIAVKNAASTLERCLCSVIGQTYLNKEILVVDGGSTDGSLKIARRWIRHLDYFTAAPDTGVYQAWNQALSHANGDWITFLGADDVLWNERVFNNLRPYLAQARTESIRIVYGKVARIDRQGCTVGICGAPWRRIRWLLPHGMPFVHAGVFHHRNLFRVHGPFDEGFAIAGDYEMMLRELRQRQALFAEDVITVAHSLAGVSGTRKIATLVEIAAARRRHGLPRFSWVWTAVYLRERVKEILAQHSAGLRKVSSR